MLPAYKLRNLLAPAVKASDSRPDKVVPLVDARQMMLLCGVCVSVLNEHTQTGWLRDGCFVTQDLIDGIIVHTHTQYAA